MSHTGVSRMPANSRRQTGDTNPQAYHAVNNKCSACVVGGQGSKQRGVHSNNSSAATRSQGGQHLLLADARQLPPSLSVCVFCGCQRPGPCGRTTRQP
jgi:hypothetical protein